MAKEFIRFREKKKHFIAVDKKYLQYRVGSCMYAKKITIIVLFYASTRRSKMKSYSTTYLGDLVAEFILMKVKFLQFPFHLK